jgi:flagellar hook-basal body complex protein FliE
MIAPIPPLPPTPTAGPASPAGGAAGSAGASNTSSGFSNLLGSAVDSLQSSEAGANQAALGVAAGTESLPDYMVQATQAEMSAELTVAVRNAAMTSLNQILDM